MFFYYPYRTRKLPGMEALEGRTPHTEGTIGRDFGSGLSKNVSLRKLVVAGVWGDGAFHEPTWRDAIEKNSTLHELALLGSSQSLNTTSLVSFVGGMARNRSMKTLSMEGMGIDNTSAAALAGAIHMSNVLESVKLVDNLIEGPEGAAAFCALFRCKSLTHLDVSHNMFGAGHDQVATVFPEGLPSNNNLVTLIVTACDFSPADVCAIFNSFRGSSSIREVRSDDRNGLDQSCTMAMRGLLETISLDKLKVCAYNGIAGGFEEIAAGVRVNATLKELIGMVDCTGILAIGHALTVNLTLESLDASYAGATNQGLRGFVALLPRVKGLKNLKLLVLGIEFELDESLVESIVDGIRRNTSLESFELEGYVGEFVSMWKQIDFYLRLNRNGRKHLNAEGELVPRGAWAPFLAKLACPSNRDQLVYCLRHKPDILNGGVGGEP